MQYHIIDVFTDKLFSGNPAGVCLLDKWLPDDILQNIAGMLFCEDCGERVKIGGKAVRYLRGNIELTRGTI